MFLLATSKFFFINVIALLASCHLIICTRPRPNEHHMKEDAVFHEKTFSVTSQSNKARVPTKWPMDTWVTDQMTKASSSSSSRVDAASSSHSPLAENIKCSTKTTEFFTAVISQPFGFGNVPLFEDAIALNPLTSEDCQMKPSGSNFLMKINDFSKCGVTSQKGSDGKEWLAVSIVFPYIGKIRTSDDEHIMIMCKPQDRIATKSHVMDYKPNMATGPRAIYHSPNQELDTKILMYTRKSSSSSFTEEVSQNALIEVGKDLQIRAVVRPGDGWKFAKLKDVTIQKTSHGSNNDKGKNKVDKNTGDTAYLVLEDGCRNPVYAAIAPKHPSVDANNPLVVNFMFKAFMFQDMADGDTLRISAKIVACQEQSDCQPGVCVDDDLPGHGRRKRNVIQTTASVNKDVQNNNSTCIHDWTRGFEFSVIMPGYSKNRIDANTVELFKDGFRIVSTESARCRNVIFATSLVSMVLVVTTAVTAIVSLKCKQNVISKCSSEESLPTCASLASSPPASGLRKNPNVPVLIASSNIQGLHTRILNTSQ